MGHINLRYTGSTPGADSNTYPIFSTVTAFTGKDFFALAGIAKIRLDLKNSHSGTLKWYKSDDRGTNWHQVDQQAIAAPAATATNSIEILVEGFKDFKLDWVNGGTAQTTWEVDVAFTSDRSAYV